MGIIRTVENIFGGETFYRDGDIVGRSVENIFGGRTIFNADGEIIARTVEGMFGGETIYTYEDDEPFEPPMLKPSAEWIDDFKFSNDDEEDF